MFSLRISGQGWFQYLQDCQMITSSTINYIYMVQSEMPYQENGRLFKRNEQILLILDVKFTTDGPFTLYM